MGGKPEAESTKKPPKRKMTPEEQSELFIKTARELGVDETGKQFERLFDKIASSKAQIPLTGGKPNRLPNKRSKSPI